MSVELHRNELENFAAFLDEQALGPRYLAGAAHIRGAIRAYDQLSDRSVMERTEHSLEVAALRLRIRQLEERP